MFEVNCLAGKSQGQRTMPAASTYPTCVRDGVFDGIVFVGDEAIARNDNLCDGLRSS